VKPVLTKTIAISAEDVYVTLASVSLGSKNNSPRVNILICRKTGEFGGYMRSEREGVIETRVVVGTCCDDESRQHLSSSEVSSSSI